MLLNLNTLPTPILNDLAARAAAARQSSQEYAAALLIEAISDRRSRPVSQFSLTPKQAELLAFIKRYQSAHRGLSPSFDEMMGGIGLMSKGGLGRMLDSMQDRGAIRRLPGRVRAIEVVGGRGGMEVGK